MIEVTRTQLLPGVHLTAVQTQKFKSSVLGMQFLLPLAREQAALHALLPMVLRRGTAEHPDMESLSAVLDELYGGSLEPTVRKKGETQCVGFVGSFLDDAYTLDGSAVLEPSAALLGELVLRPYTRDEVFCPDYTRQERENLVTRIRAQVNDKRQYAQVRVVAEMCAGEPFGVDKLGDEASAAAITPQKLWDCYQQVLRTAPIEFYYCGSAPLERVRAAVQAIVDGLPAGERAPLARPEKGNAPAQPRRVEEALDVTQGKLAMGFRTCNDAWDEDYPALMLLKRALGDAPLFIPALHNERAADAAQVVAAANAAAPAHATLLPDVRNALDAVRDLPGDDRAPVIISGSLYMLAEFYGLYPHLLEQPASARGAKEDA